MMWPCDSFKYKTKTGAPKQCYINNVLRAWGGGNCVMLLHWIKWTSLKIGFIWEAFNLFQLPIKKAEVKVLDRLAQTKLSSWAFPSKGQLCCLCCKQPLSYASTSSWRGHSAISLANENQPRLVLEPADFIWRRGANVLAAAASAADHMYSHHARWLFTPPLHTVSEHGQGRGNLLNQPASAHQSIILALPMDEVVVSPKPDSRSKAICADRVIICGSYDKCEMPAQ